ncbi:MAG: undecaprenyl-diphosphate phosphatase [Candidatus Heimdallarchaeota archaeon]
MGKQGCVVKHFSIVKLNDCRTQMMSLTFLIVASLLQGLLEWLPVSSEGQNVLFLISLIGDPELALSLSLFLHLGTACTVLVYYRHLVVKLITSNAPTQKIGDLRRILVFVTLGTGFSGVILFIYFLDLVGAYSGSVIMGLVGILLIVTASILYFSKRMGGKRRFHQLSNYEAVILGIIQGIAVLPGISRSGLTIAALLWLRNDQENALFGSFLMSIPASFGVVFLEAVTGTLPSLRFWQILLTLALTFVTGYLSMDFLLRLSRRMNFPLFCLLLGLIALILNVPY